MVINFNQQEETHMETLEQKRTRLAKECMYCLQQILIRLQSVDKRLGRNAEQIILEEI